MRQIIGTGTARGYNISRLFAREEPYEHSTDHRIRVTPGGTALTAEAAAQIAEDFIADHLGNLALAGIPRRIIFPIRALWAVPITVAYPRYGLAGVIGIVAIDDEFASAVAATPIEEMRQATEQLYKQHQSDIESAFRQITSAND